MGPEPPSSFILTATGDESLAERFDSIKNLSVRDALAQLSDIWPQVTIALAVLVAIFLFAAGVLRPGGFVKSGIRDVTPYPALMWLFAGIVVFLSQQMAMQWASQTPAIVGSGPLDGLQGEAGRASVGCAIAAVVGLGLMYLMGKSAPEAGLKIGGLDPLLGAGCFLLAMPLVQVTAMISEAIYRQVNGADPPVLAHNTLRLIVEERGQPLVWLLIAAVVIGAPIVEELIFRAGLQSAILKLTGSPWGAVLGTSTLFTLMHLSVVPPDGRYALGQLFVLSVAMGIAFERTKRLGVPIVMHICFNALTVLLALTLTDSGAGSAVAGR